MAYSWVKVTGSANHDRSSLWRGAYTPETHQGRKQWWTFSAYAISTQDQFPLVCVPLSLRIWGPGHSCVPVKRTISLRAFHSGRLCSLYWGDS